MAETRDVCIPEVHRGTKLGRWLPLVIAIFIILLHVIIQIDIPSVFVILFNSSSRP